MLVKLRPEKFAATDIGALLIRGSTPEAWLGAIRGSGISLLRSQTFLVPGITPDKPLGCVIVAAGLHSKSFGPEATELQYAAPRLLIPVNTALSPDATAGELEALLPPGLHLLHPSIGLLPLELPYDWMVRLNIARETSVSIRVPAPPVFRPAIIRLFEVEAPAPEEGLRALESRALEGAKPPEDKPLSPAEKLRLKLYRMLFKPDRDGEVRESWLSRKLAALLPADGEKPVSGSRLRDDFEDLERRNASEIDKLLRMLKENPGEALKYALPIGEGAGRGQPGSFQLGLLWKTLALFGNVYGNGTGNSGSVHLPEDVQARLVREYNQSAEALIAKGDFEKAAFVYLKLLKNYAKAAQTLENGGLFAEAAAVFEEYVKNVREAARCYERANMLTKAGELYAKAGAHEQAGDVYLRLNREADAMASFGLAVTDQVKQRHFREAARITRFKLHNADRANGYLRDGWLARKDFTGCMQDYLEAIPGDEERLRALHVIRDQDINAGNYAPFLGILRKEANAAAANREPIRELAIGIIGERAATDPSIISELRFFNEADTLIMRDILRYKIRKKKA